MNIVYVLLTVFVLPFGLLAWLDVLYTLTH